MRSFSAFLFIAVLCAAPVAAQNTVILLDTTTAQWSPSPDHDATFGTPPVPLVTKYIARLYAKSAVIGGVEPATAPLLTLDFGKPPVIAGVETSPPLKPLIQVGIEYVAFLHAANASATSPPTNASDPFGLAPLPRAASGLVLKP